MPKLWPSAASVAAHVPPPPAAWPPPSPTHATRQTLMPGRPAPAGSKLSPRSAAGSPSHQPMNAILRRPWPHTATPIGTEAAAQCFGIGHCAWCAPTTHTPPTTGPRAASAAARVPPALADSSRHQRTLATRRTPMRHRSSRVGPAWCAASSSWQPRPTTTRNTSSHLASSIAARSSPQPVPAARRRLIAA